MGLLNYNKLLFLLLFLPFVSFGQNISGRVNDKKTGDNIQGALITLYDINNIIISYTTVKSSGDYSLVYKENICFIECSMIGFKKTRYDFIKNNYVYNFLLEQEVFKLNEVYVKAPAVEKRSDTIEFNVDSFATMQARKLE